jgi:hypothetical protein
MFFTDCPSIVLFLRRNRRSGMKRLIYGILAGLLVCAPVPCFGRSPQAIGEMVQIQPKVPAPSLAGNKALISRQPTVKGTSGTSQIITVGRSHYRLPAKKTTADPNQPEFVIYGSDAPSDADVKNDASTGQSQKPPAAPAKVEGASPSAQKTQAQSPPS